MILRSPILDKAPVRVLSHNIRQTLVGRNVGESDYSLSMELSATVDRISCLVFAPDQIFFQCSVAVAIYRW